MKSHEKIKEAQRLLQEAHQELSGFLKTERGRRRGEALRQIHAVSNMLASTPLCFSQSGQDRMMDRLFDGKRDGVFVDVGGYDGVTGSNTLFFEMFRGWSGVLIEPSPTQLERASMVRKCPCLGAAIAGEIGTSDFIDVTSGYTQMSGFLDSYDSKLLTKVRANPQHKETIHTLPKQTLQSVLKEQNLNKIDFISVDVEGGEIDILTDFPYGDFDIDVFCIENNAQSSNLPQLMKSKGYELLEFIGVDDIYRKLKA